ncbi:hypothetical protein B1A_17263, partial [mine drainage metagenome]
NGNGVVVRAFLRLGTLMADPDLLGSAERTLLLFSGAFNDRPEGYDTLLGGLSDWLSGVPSVILKGEDAGRWQRAISRAGLSCWSVILPEDLSGAPLPEPLVKPWPSSGGTRAYICGTFGCLPPVDGGPEALVDALTRVKASGGPSGRMADA